MPEKPDKFKVQGDSDVNIPQGNQPNAPLQPAQADDPAVQGSLQGAVGGQDIVEVVFRYPDGREEIIKVVNTDFVYHSAKAEQVIAPPRSASYPETAKASSFHTSSSPSVVDLQQAGSADVLQPQVQGAPEEGVRDVGDQQMQHVVQPAEENVVDVPDDSAQPGGANVDQPAGQNATAPLQPVPADVDEPANLNVGAPLQPVPANVVPVPPPAGQPADVSTTQQASGSAATATSSGSTSETSAMTSNTRYSSYSSPNVSHGGAEGGASATGRLASTPLVR